ncbi:9081_t:CDS:2 [Entrophospora sp. SA101]|nr:13849_t:CDS:2 [Entrophospora sp. SA101]CAJ0842268.1 1671_t:CDS:2 [Entrophospora sp. SA101]CAJ0908227.1 9081_t:CDS:2 [Entrophospora sp. SA101]
MDLDSEELSTNLNPKSSSNDLNNFETHNYPSNKKITYKKHNKYYLYEIIKEGIYPETLKYTKSNGKGDTCPIPNEYLVETEFGRTTKYKFQCSIRYYNNNPIYYLNWKDGEGKIHQVTSQKSSTDAAQKYFQANDKNTTNMSGILLFGLQLQCVHNQRIHKQNKNKKNKLISFEEAKDTTCRYRLKSLGNQFLDDFNKSSNSILNSNSSEIVGITIKINDQLYQLCFKEDEDEKKLHAEAVAQQLDVHNISQAGYRSLARIESNLPRENMVSNVKKEITNLMNNEIPIVPLNLDFQNNDENNPDNENDEIDSHENLDVEIRNEIINSQDQGGYRSIKKVLDYVIKILIKKNILDHSLDNKIHIRISGDGRNVGRKIKHVMITFAILNDINNIFQPDNHYCLVLYSGIEKYEYSKNALYYLTRRY